MTISVRRGLPSDLFAATASFQLISIFCLHSSLSAVVLEIGKSISYHFAAQKVLSILNIPRPVSNVSWTAHTKAPEKAVNELLERELKNAMLQLKRHKRTSSVH